MKPFDNDMIINRIKSTRVLRGMNAAESKKSEHMRKAFDKAGGSGK